MDNYNDSNPLNNSTDSFDENLSSAPLQLPSQSEIKNTTDTPDDAYNNDDDNEPENFDEIERPKIVYYDEIGLLRKIVQYIFIVLLSGCFIWGIIIQFLYGISLALIDDCAILSVVLIMLYYTLKKRATAGRKFGGYTLAVTFFGFGIRGISPAFQNKGVLIQIGLLIARTLILMFCTTLNCNR